MSKCRAGSKDCCMCRIMFHQPDFIEAKSLLETMAKSYGFEVLLLPKYHCELNPIEQCWGYAKRLYRHNPPSSREEDLEKNTIAALNAVPIVSMRRFANRSHRFGELYVLGMDGEHAVWIKKKYRGHRVVTTRIMETFDLRIPLTRAQRS
jgi:hypothetical protein